MRLTKVKLGPKIDLMDGIQVGYTRVELRLSLEGGPEATRKLIDQILSGTPSLETISLALSPELENREPLVVVSVRAGTDGAPTFCQAVEVGRTVAIASVPPLELRVDLK